VTAAETQVQLGVDATKAFDLLHTACAGLLGEEGPIKVAVSRAIIGWPDVVVVVEIKRSAHRAVGASGRQSSTAGGPAVGKGWKEGKTRRCGVCRREVVGI
jgi:hypothetical protein